MALHLRPKYAILAAAGVVPYLYALWFVLAGPAGDWVFVVHAAAFLGTAAVIAWAVADVARHPRLTGTAELVWGLAIIVVPAATVPYVLTHRQSAGARR